MEKKFTLMKTLTAFLELLFPRRKNSRALNTVNNASTSVTGCGTEATAINELHYIDDPDKSGSFLFFNHVAIDGQQSVDNGQEAIDNSDKSKSKEEIKKVNDELASLSKQVYKNWRERVNDDLAACSPIVKPGSVVEARESVTVINDLKNIFPTTTVNNETRTNENDAWLPFASFCFSALCQGIGDLFSNAGLSKSQKPVLLTVPIRSRQTRKPNDSDGIKL